MKILFFGDIFGRPGREAVKVVLPKLQRKYEPDLIIGNAENLAHGKGISERVVREVLDAGIDFLTSGNHVWEGERAKTLLDDKTLPIIRPANYPPGVPGRGFALVKVRTRLVLVINIVGRVFMHIDPDCPFRKMDEILEETGEETPIKIVDWHSEASSEKKAMGWHLDGRVSAVLGTHTHVATCDLRILPQGTAYISDVGMVGPHNSVIGADPSVSIRHFLTQLPAKLEIASGPVEVNAVFLEVDNKTGKCKEAKQIQEIIDLAF